MGPRREFYCKCDIVKELKRCVCGVMMSLWRKTLGLALQCRPLILTSSSRISCCSARLAKLTHTNTSLTSRSSERLLGTEL